MPVFRDTKAALVLLMNDAFTRPGTRFWFTPKQGFTGVCQDLGKQDFYTYTKQTFEKAHFEEKSLLWNKNEL